MDEPAKKRLSPEAQEKLAQALRARLSRGRPRPVVWTMVSVGLFAAAIVGLSYGIRTREPLPPLMLVVFDGVDEEETVRAQLVAPGNPETNLEGLEIEWVWGDELGSSKTDRLGQARYRLGTGRAAGPRGNGDKSCVVVSFVDPEGVYRRDGRIELKR